MRGNTYQPSSLNTAGIWVIAAEKRDFWSTELLGLNMYVPYVEFCLGSIVFASFHQYYSILIKL